MGIAKTTNSGALLSAFSASLKGSKEGEPVLQLERGASSEAVLVVQGYGRRKSVRLPVSPLQFPSRRLLTEGKLAGRLLLSPHLPESLAADLRAAGISHADLNGRLFIKSPALLIDRAPREKKHRGLSAGVEVFTGKTSRLTRAMLATRAKSWTQEELAARTGLSRGLVSRALSWLVENDYVDTATTRHREATRYTVRASQPLLDAWVRKDNWVGRCEIYEYSVLSDDYLRNAERLQEAVGGAGLCFTQWIAAWLRRPHTTPPVVSAYLRDRAQLDRAPGKRVDSGGNVWLLVPADEGIFSETQEVGGLTLVADVQIYLDLVNTGLRGPEAAEELRSWEGFGQ